jgi:hypothetical protein
LGKTGWKDGGRGSQGRATSHFLKFDWLKGQNQPSFDDVLPDQPLKTSLSPTAAPFVPSSLSSCSKSNSSSSDRNVVKNNNNNTSTSAVIKNTNSNNENNQINVSSSAGSENSSKSSSKNNNNNIKNISSPLPSSTSILFSTISDGILPQDRAYVIPFPTLVAIPSSIDQALLRTDDLVHSDPSTFPLHSKDVSVMNRIYIVKEMKNRDPVLREKMIKMHRYLHDPLVYEPLPKRSADNCPYASVLVSDIDVLLKADNIRPIHRSQVKGHLKMFTVTEHHKRRRRPIRHTFEVNDYLGKETLQGIKFPTKKEICEFVLHGDYCAAFDMSAYYDQFGLENGVGDYMCCRKDGKFYACNRLAMGQRQGCDIAQLTTLFLMDFPERRCRTGNAVIDNTIFVGSYEDVLHDSKIFVARCKAAGITLNEYPQIEKDGIESCITQRTEWCGVKLDFEKKTVQLTDKTLQKIVISNNNFNNWSYRKFAAHIGLLFWTWGILDIPLQEFYPLLRFISETSRYLQQNESAWDQPIKIAPSALPALRKWTTIALNNSPNTMKKSSQNRWFLCTDASAYGWGYAAYNSETGEIRAFGMKWSNEQLKKIFGRNGRSKVKHSVYSEPLAIYHSLCHFLKAGEDIKLEFFDEFKDDLCMKIKLATDNSSAKHTFNRGFASRSFDINEVIKQLKNAFPRSQFEFDFCFVPGWCNPADPFSRGKASNVAAKLGETNSNNNKVNVDRLRRQMAELRESTA